MERYATMTARYTDGKMTFTVGRMIVKVGEVTFTVGGKTIVTDNYMYCAYRSHINHMQCAHPDNWIRLDGTDEDGKHYAIWYKYGKDVEIADWKQPNDIEDEYGDCVWSNEDC